MGLLDTITSPGGLTGLSSGPSRGLDIRKAKITSKTETLDKKIDEQLKLLNIGKKNDKTKDKLVNKLMRKLKTANKGLVLSEVEDAYEWDSMGLIEVEPEDVTKMINNIRWSVADLNENLQRVDTRIQQDPAIASIRDPNAPGGNLTPWGGKITGAAPTAGESIKFAGEARGMGFEETQDILAYRGRDSGIPGEYTRVGVADFYGRPPSDPDYDPNTGFMRTDEFAFATIPATTGERVYDLTRQYGFDDTSTSRRLASDFVEDRTLTYFSLFPSRNLQGQLISPITKKGSNTIDARNFAFAQNLMNNVKNSVTSIIGYSGEVSTAVVEQLVDDEYNKFWDLMEKHALGWNALNKAKKKTYIKDNNLGSNQVNTLDMFAKPFVTNTTSTDGTQIFKTKRATTSRLYRPTNSSTRVPVAHLWQPNGTITILFNDMSRIENADVKDPAIAPYL